MSRDEGIAASRGDEVDQKKSAVVLTLGCAFKPPGGNFKKPDNLGHTTELYN